MPIIKWGYTYQTMLKLIDETLQRNIASNLFLYTSSTIKYSGVKMAGKRENKESKHVTKPLCKLIKEDKLEELKGYIPVNEFGINVQKAINIDIVAFDQDFGLNGNYNAVAIECKYNDANINHAIQTALAQAILYQTSFKKVYIAVNKNNSKPNDYVTKILKKLGIGLITLSHKRAKVEICPKSDKLDLFSKTLYKNNILYRVFIIAAFSRACSAKDYPKSNLDFKWKQSKQSNGGSLHLWVAMPIKGKKLYLGCAYQLELNGNEYKVIEAVLRISIKKSLVPDESAKKQIANRFPDAGNDGIPRRDDQRGRVQEWDYNLRSLIEKENKKGIQKIMKDRVSWVNNNIKGKIP